MDTDYLQKAIEESDMDSLPQAIEEVVHMWRQCRIEEYKLSGGTCIKGNEEHTLPYKHPFDPLSQYDLILLYCRYNNLLSVLVQGVHKR